MATRSLRPLIQITTALLVACSAALVHGQAPTASASAAPDLPVRRVVLYKSGVGYFEHRGTIHGAQRVTLDFTSGQLDDVLQSMTALDLGGGRIVSISYNSEAALDRRLGSLRLPIGDATSRADLLEALRGARVEITGGAAPIVGRLLSVQRTQRRDHDLVSDVDEVSIVSDTGTVTTTALGAGAGVKLLDEGVNQEVGRYLTLLSSARDADVRRVTIDTAGTGARDLFVSYVSEVPVWKATYRLVLPAAGASTKPLLQGWAIVDNTGTEDWTNVQLSLVAGAPQSFIQHVSQPYYVQRPVVPLPDRVQLTPQTHQTATMVTAMAGSPSVPPPPPAPSASPAAAQPVAPGFGSGGGGRGGRGGAAGAASDRSSVVGGIAAGLAVDTLNGALDSSLSPSQLLAQMTPDASAAALGDLFEYTLNTPVTIPRNQSALVPITSGTVDADKVSIWNPSTNGGRVLRGVWLTNTTGSTLDAGSFSVTEGDAFAGQGLLDPLQPGERRLLSYAADVGLHVDAKIEPAPPTSTTVRISRGVLIQTVAERQRRVYTVRNEHPESCVLILEHPARAGWTIDSAVKPVEVTAAWDRFRLTVDSKTSVTLTVDESRPLRTQIALTSITDDQVARLTTQGALTPEVQASLAEIISRKAAIAKLAGDIAARQHDIDAIGQDQQRVRDNMQALKGSAEEKQLLQRYVKQLGDQETQLDALRRELAALTRERDSAQEALNTFIDGLGGPES